MTAQAHSVSKTAALGRAIQRARLGAGYRQQDVAKLIDRHQQYVSLLESGQIVDPHPELLAVLARTYAVDVVEWFQLIGYNELTALIRGPAVPGKAKPPRVPKPRGTPRVRYPHGNSISR
jgi:transcriptional regulator with XRE-family HTH domain